MHNMGDSEDSEIDVCSVDDEMSSTNHAGLTLVAAETYVSNNHAYEGWLFMLFFHLSLVSSSCKIVCAK